MQVCCVEGCVGPKNADPVFFDFPTSRLLRKRWLDAINAPSKVAQDAVICIRHFGNEDYELVRGKTRLKSRVVPKLLVGGKPENYDDTETSQDSTETAASDGTTRSKTPGKESTINHTDNDDEKVHNYNKDNGKVHNDNEDNGKVSNDKDEEEEVLSENKNAKLEIITGHNDNIPNNKEEINNVTENNRLENCDGGKVETDSNKIENDEKVLNDNGKVHYDNSDVKSENKEKVPNDNGKIHNDNSDGKNENKGKIPNDNGIVQSRVRKTGCKITAKRRMNGRKVTSKVTIKDSDSSTPDSVSSSPLPPEIEGSKDDIEGILTNYYIENKKTERQVAAMTDVLQEDAERREAELSGAEQSQEDGWGFEQNEPVFIELSVGQGANTEEATENDCLMVLESVQCDVDPALLLAAREDEEIEEVDLAGDDDDDDDVQAVEKKKEDPISLLTSSDEDDVIIEEPNIDTVEVSSADTSEDDMPLVKLVKPKAKAKAKAKAKLKAFASSKRAKNLITKLLWGGKDFYCVQCRFTSVSSTEYTKHMAEHSKVLQLCQDCGFTTCSKAQMTRHKQKHKNERRYKCQKCNYTAKHKMSLVYHMKGHSFNEVEVAICDIEPASKMSRMSEKSKASEKSKSSEKSKASKAKELKKHSCSMCDYKTNRRSDLRRHRNRIHKDESTEEESDE